MPELPEIEIARQGLYPELVGKTVTAVKVRNSQLRWPIPANLSTMLVGAKIKQLERRGKFLLLDCQKKQQKGWLILHLGMSGSLRILSTDVPAEKHDHFDLELNHYRLMRLRDPRRFGCVLWETGNITQHPLISNLGIEPLSALFNSTFLYRITRNRSTSIKQTLMNNQIIVGVGNIYANESLFSAQIRPDTPAKNLTMKHCKKLVSAVKEVLRSAIKAGGSSLRDYIHSDGGLGCFQLQHKVYSRIGLACLVCKNEIKSFRQGQRSSFYCPFCQQVC